jgi:hypothetical protein
MLKQISHATAQRRNVEFRCAVAPPREIFLDELCASRPR